MLLFPEVCPSQLSLGFIAPGLDSNLYQVCLLNSTHIWCLYKRANVSHVVYDDNNQNDVAIERNMPDIDSTDLKLLFAQIDQEREIIHTLNDGIETKRQRGRPRKNVDPKHNRKTSQYNDFVRSQMKNFTHIKDTREKLKIIAKLWKANSLQPKTTNIQQVM